MLGMSSKNAYLYKKNAYGDFIHLNFSYLIYSGFQDHKNAVFSNIK